MRQAALKMKPGDLSNEPIKPYEIRQAIRLQMEWQKEINGSLAVAQWWLFAIFVAVVLF